MTFLLKGGLIATYTGAGPRAYKADVLIEGSVIKDIQPNIQAPAGAEVIDCTNK